MSDVNTRTCRCGATLPECEVRIDFCSWECRVAQARAEGCPELAPNGLPIRSIRADGLLLEHTDADHPTYVFPVEVEGTNDPGDVALGHCEYPQSHALIYTDGNIALTLYETNYAVWSLRDGEPLGGRYQYAHERLSETSCQKVREYAEEKHKRGPQ